MNQDSNEKKDKDLNYSQSNECNENFHNQILNNYDNGWKGYSVNASQSNPQMNWYNQQQNYSQGYGFIPSPAQIVEKKQIKSTSNKISLSILLYLIISNIIIFPIMLIYSALGYGSLIDFTTGKIVASPLIEQIINISIYSISIILSSFFLYFILNKPFKLSLLFKAPKASLSVLSIPMFLGFVTLSGIIVQFFYMVFSLFNIEPIMPDFTLPEQFGSFLLYAFLMTVCAAFLEEFFFRGIVMSSLRRFGDSVALIFSSVFFALIHQNFIQGLNAFILGMILGYFVMRTGSLWTGIMLHFLNNSLSLFLLYLNDTLPENQFTIISIGLNILFVFFGVIAVILFKNRDKNAFKLINRPSFLSVASKILASFTGVVTIITAIILLFTVVINFKFV